jgi:hypothetical protein
MMAVSPYARVLSVVWMPWHPPSPTAPKSVRLANHRPQGSRGTSVSKSKQGHAAVGTGAHPGIVLVVR